MSSKHVIRGVFLGNAARARELGLWWRVPTLPFLLWLPLPNPLSPAASRREALPLHLGGLHLALRPLRRADATLPQAHGDQAFPLHRVRPLLLPV